MFVRELNYFRKLQEVLKDKEGALAIDALTANLQTLLRTLLRLTSLERGGLEKGVDAADLITLQVRSSLTDFTDFLKVKAIRNFTLGSYPLIYEKLYFKIFCIMF